MNKGILLLGVILLTAGCVETGRGTTTDTIHGYEYSGLLCKTWKVWLTNDHAWGGCSGDACTGSDATYSIDPRYRDAVLPIIQKAKAENKKVTLSYRTELATWGCGDELHSGYAIIESAKIE